MLVLYPDWDSYVTSAIVSIPPLCTYIENIYCVSMFFFVPGGDENFGSCAHHKSGSSVHVRRVCRVQLAYLLKQEGAWKVEREMQGEHRSLKNRKIWCKQDNWFKCYSQCIACRVPQPGHQKIILGILLGVVSCENHADPLEIGCCHYLLWKLIGSV